jgi:predicted NBD/HSP70 family sugar kinase
MANFRTDSRIVMTLDANSAEMVFGAMQAGEFIVEPITLEAHSDNLEMCLQTMVKGFRMVREQLDRQPAAISFAFPGPADYPNGIIYGYLLNFPSFRDGVALGPYLRKKFGIPVYINNDGDLFAYGEALGGALPEINETLELAGSKKRFRNMLGYVFGDGFAVGMIVNETLNRGDNSCVETCYFPHSKYPEIIVEEGVSIRAVKRVYKEISGDERELEPKDIFDIAEGNLEGDREAAVRAFAEMGEVTGEAILPSANITDGLIVLGGGMTGAAKYIKPAILEVMRSKIKTLDGKELGRIPMKVYDLDDKEELAAFVKGEQQKMKIYGSEIEVDFDPQKRIGVTISKMGAGKAIAIGAYAFALDQLDRRNGISRF